MATDKPKTTTKPKDKAADFKRIAADRVEKAIHRIRLVGNCANRSTYDYTPEQVERIHRALEHELDTAMARFTQKAKAATFTL